MITFSSIYTLKILTNVKILVLFHSYNYNLLKIDVQFIRAYAVHLCKTRAI